MHLAAVDDHLAHADALKSIGLERSDTDPVAVGWAITALFYAALHALRAYLRACKKIEVTSHDEFKWHVEEFPELKKTNVDYNLLKQQSQSARYYCNRNFTWSDYDKLRSKAQRIASIWKPEAQKCADGARPPQH